MCRVQVIDFNIRAARDAEVVKMEKFSLDALAREHLERARESGAGRSSATVYGGHEHLLRQTVIALTQGSMLAAHENPGESTLHVLLGRVRLTTGATSWESRSGDLLIIPPSRHDVLALEDSVFLLTVALLI
jgi:quercetin dioxygenase-like cupin family protein